ncbi:MAG: hypothetical protein ACI80V_000953 [Rhodothermales bacterium]
MHGGKLTSEFSLDFVCGLEKAQRLLSLGYVVILLFLFRE